MKKRLFLLFFIVVHCILIFNISYASTFSDLTGTKYEEAVENLYELGIVNGMPDGTYSALSTVTRGQMAKMLMLSLEGDYERDYLSSFKSFDDTIGHWAESYSKLANRYGVVRGYEDGSFKPDKNVTYAEAIAMVTRVLYNGKIFNNPDGAWYESYMKKASDIGLLRNITNVSANDNLNRGDTAILINNLLEVIKGDKSDKKIINIGSWENGYVNENETMSIKLRDEKDGTVTLSVREYDDFWEGYEEEENKFQIVSSTDDELYIGISFYDVNLDSYDTNNLPIYNVIWEDEIIKFSKIENDIKIEIIQGKEEKLKLDTFNTYELKKDVTFESINNYGQKVTKKLIEMKGKYSGNDLCDKKMNEISNLIGCRALYPINITFENKTNYDIGFYFIDNDEEINENVGYISGQYAILLSDETVIDLDFEVDEKGIISKIIFK